MYEKGIAGKEDIDKMVKEISERIASEEGVPVDFKNHGYGILKKFSDVNYNESKKYLS